MKWLSLRHGEQEPLKMKITADSEENAERQNALAGSVG